MVLELMVPPTSRLGSVVATHASRARGSPGLVFLFPFYNWGRIRVLGRRLVGGAKDCRSNDVVERSVLAEGQPSFEQGTSV